MLNFSEEEFEKIKRDSEEYYKSIQDRVVCPYFKEKIVFNSKGLEHLKFLRKNHARPRKDQYMRFKLLHFAAKVLGSSNTIQGISHTKSFELIRSNAKNEMVMSPISYYEFIAIVENVRVRVVVKQVDGGPKYFWSIIPFWKFDKDKKKRRMHYGNPEED